VRWTRRQDVLGGPLTLTAGAEYDGSSEARQGFINNLGAKGALKRDEDNDVDSLGAYLQAEWWVVPRASLSLGVRYTKVDFSSDDRYIAIDNPDDSGSMSYGEWTPTVGLLFRATPTVNVYVSYGRAFETPTGIELAYRPDGASGFNFALQPSTSDQFEVGAKALLGAATRINVAVFKIRTEGEIVIARSTGGRSSYQNAGDSSRLGAELMLETELADELSTHLALTFLNARYDSSFQSCAPLAAFCNPLTGVNTAAVPAGNRIPGVPNASLFADLAYRDPGFGLAGAFEVVANGPVAVDDFNSQYAAGYAIANLWAGLEQVAGHWRFSEFVRVNNLFGREYIGAVIVGDSNGRYYAPAPTRNVLFGVSARHSF
jgi:iron complex outermembrane receptor protein